MHTIGEAARLTDLATKTVRYYADINLVIPSSRSDKGYRLYGENELRKLYFVRQARSFGFSVDSCRELLSLYEDRSRSSRDVKSIAQSRIQELDEKMVELKSLRDELAHLAGNCHGDDRPDCPILDSFSSFDK